MKQSDDFEIYRQSPPRPVTLWRLLGGLAIALGCWLGASVLFVIVGSVVSRGNLDTFSTSRVGTLAMFATFGGIWFGLWLAMRYLHREPLKNLFGAGGRLSWGDFQRGFAAVVLTSLLSELLLYLVWPEMTRSPLGIGQWLTYLVPVALLCFVQTSSEELLFRGYLLRGLANRFRSPWIWGLVPGLGFIALHLTTGMNGNDVLLVVFTIGALTVALTIVVYATGNLGAAFGMHMANNLFAFTLVSHQNDFSQFALVRGVQLEGDLSPARLITLAAISLACIALTLVLLLHKASPLRLRGANEDLRETFV
ncbi:CPBP family intramembrane metalloprotease [Salmonella enterica subsp. enterica]|nr:CPBP family intramembrane metalloprotease [Escherichia coli]MIL09826.1 CPBP family intramembrane metalloprotease [Salmonella enterica subsp. enterica serovar Enteritidis]